MTSLLILDVDGVLTNGQLTPMPDGDTHMMFCSQDGVAIKLWQAQGRKVALISGRKSQLVPRRAAELGIEYAQTGIDNKLHAFRNILTQLNVEAEYSAYVGDDFPDLPVMRACGLAIAVVNAVPEIKRAAQFVTRRRGGDGAASEVIEWLLRVEGCWKVAGKRA